jgi:tRNA pseudouridine(38-40) synthase
VQRGFAPEPEALRLEVASRTDRGVHARANALAVTSDLPGPALLRALNGLAPDLWFSAATPVEEGFAVRRAIERRYRYFEPRERVRIDRWREAARRFAGPINVGSFSRGIPAGQPASRVVTSVTARPVGAWVELELRAPAFVWGMVRKIVAALRAYDAGELTMAELDEALHGRRRLSLPLAEPDRLVLWSVDLRRRYRFHVPAPTRRQTERLEAELTAARLRARLLPRLRPRTPRSTSV